MRGVRQPRARGRVHALASGLLAREKVASSKEGFGRCCDSLAADGPCGCSQPAAHVRSST